MKILSITWKDLNIFFREPGHLIYLILLPLVFITLFTTLFSASSGPAVDPQKTSLVVVNLDEKEALSQVFIDGLQQTGSIAVILSTQVEAESDFSDTRITRYLTIPQDFSSRIEAGEKTDITFKALDTQSMEIQSLRMKIDGVANNMMLERNILDSLIQFTEMQPAASEGEQPFNLEMLTDQAESQFKSSKERPLVNLEVQFPQSEATADLGFSMAQFSVPGFAVLFAFLVAQSTARSIYEEKKTGSFRRLQAAPMKKIELLSGKLLPNLFIVLIQMTVIFAVSTLLLPLLGMERLSLGNSAGVLVAISFCVALCSTSLGIFIAAIAKTESQIGGVSTLFLWLMSFLGGTMVPLDILSSSFLITISKFIPHSYAVTAYRAALTQGAGFNAILPLLGILLAFSALFFSLGLWRFEFD
jgi:ABC-2 type transport system permease protein